MFIVLAIVVAHFWMLLVAMLILWLVVKYIRLVVADTRTRTKLVEFEAAHEPAKALPAEPVYMRRWTTMRRKDARRELAQWQELFDTHLV